MSRHFCEALLPYTLRRGLLLFMKLKVKRNRKGKAFWDGEYKDKSYLAISMNPSEDLEKFTRWLERAYGKIYLNVTTSVLDLGSGNGRNLAWLAEQYGVKGIGYDISFEATKQAIAYAAAHNLKLTYEARSIAGLLTIPDSSQSLVLDMMTSHFLTQEQRKVLIEETFRVLKPGGFLFYKTFLLDEDKNAKRMIVENPGDEENTYIHPTIGVAEHVSTQEEIETLYGGKFITHKVYTSHRHTGRHAKRRSITVYLQKPEF